MSPAQHSKGPWVQSLTDKGYHYGQILGSDGEIVASVGYRRMPNDPEDFANARLIAAAPELLAALEETLRALEQHLDDDANAHGLKSRDNLCPCSTNEVVRARAAIAKAKGAANP